MFFTFVGVMHNTAVAILPAAERDMPVIIQLAKRMDLDSETMTYRQFVVAKDNNTVIGFGRLIQYYGNPQCTEIATVGVIPEIRNKGVGSRIVKELVRLGPRELFVTCVIPDFFKKLGFKSVKEYPAVLQKKVDFCKSYNFCDEQIFVMKITR